MTVTASRLKPLGFGILGLTVGLGASQLVFAQDAALIVDTRNAVASANWADNVTITIDEDANTFNFSSDSIPSHGFADAYLIPINPNNQPFAGQPIENFDVVAGADLEASPIDTDITTLPVYADMATNTGLGRIGVAISGANIVNDYENTQRSVVAMDDNVIHDHAAFLDACNGHPLAVGSNYHYHGIPVCITVDLDVAGEHSYMLGVLVDGFPVYANQDVNGEIIGDRDLDECSGHFGPTPEFPEGIYHYHLTADDAPYMIDCYHGEIEVAANSGPDGGGGPDLTNAKVEHNHRALAVDPELPIPSLTFLAFPGTMDGYNVQILSQNFTFTPASINRDNIANEGHAHIYVDGAKIAQVYGNWYHLPASFLKPGANAVTVTLNANDHSTWALPEGELIASTVAVIRPTVDE
ncbi:MAG: YHYH protein [Paracoccaceae bacterium]